MRIPNLESMIQVVEQDITYTVCENCYLYLHEHKLISIGVRETNEDYMVLLVCPLNAMIFKGMNGTDYVQFQSKLMSQSDALYYAHQNDQYDYTASQGG